MKKNKINAMNTFLGNESEEDFEENLTTQEKKVKTSNKKMVEVVNPVLIMEDGRQLLNG